MILTWLIGAVIVGFIGSSISRIGWFMSFFWSLLLSPIVGLIIVLCTQKKDEKLLEAVSEIKNNTATSATSDKIAKIVEAKGLLDSGAISEDEFNILKKELLGADAQATATPKAVENNFNNLLK